MLTPCVQVSLVARGAEFEKSKRLSKSNKRDIPRRSLPKHELPKRALPTPPDDNDEAAFDKWISDIFGGGQVLGAPKDGDLGVSLHPPFPI